MTKLGLSLAAAALLISGGIASAQNQTPTQYDSSGAPKTGQGPNAGPNEGGGMPSNSGMTRGGAGTTTGAGASGTPSSTNPQAGSGTTAPREVPENGGAATQTVPGPGR
jgi:hypothetical protein